MNYHSRFLIRLCLSVIVVGVCKSGLSEYRYTRIADTESAAPVGKFGFFAGASISGDTVAFQGLYGSAAGIFTGNGGPLTTIARTGDSGPNGIFTFFGTAGSPAIDASKVAFFASTAAGSGIFWQDGSSLTTIAKTGDAAPVGLFEGIFPASISTSNGVTLFLGKDDGGSGVFKSSHGTVAEIVRLGDATPVGGTFTSINAAAISGNTVALGAADRGQGAIYLSEGGPFIEIARHGSPTPLGPLNFFSALGIAIDDGKVAFNASYSGGQGVFKGSGTSITPIASSDSPAPSGTFSSFGAPSIGDEMVAFSARYGGGGQGVFVGSGGPLEAVIKTGDTLFGSSLSSVPGEVGIDPYGSGGVVFSYVLANGVRGIAVAVPVPEPNSMLIAAFIICAPIRCRLRSERLQPYSANKN